MRVNLIQNTYTKPNEINPHQIGQFTSVKNIKTNQITNNVLYCYNKPIAFGFKLVLNKPQMIEAMELFPIGKHSEIINYIENAFSEQNIDKEFDLLLKSIIRNDTEKYAIKKRNINSSMWENGYSRLIKDRFGEWEHLMKVKDIVPGFDSSVIELTFVKNKKNHPCCAGKCNLNGKEIKNDNPSDFYEIYYDKGLDIGVYNPIHGFLKHLLVNILEDHSSMFRDFMSKSEDLASKCLI